MRNVAKKIDAGKLIRTMRRVATWKHTRAPMPPSLARWLLVPGGPTSVTPEQKAQLRGWLVKRSEDHSGYRGVPGSESRLEVAHEAELLDAAASGDVVLMIAEAHGTIARLALLEMVGGRDLGSAAKAGR